MKGKCLTDIINSMMADDEMSRESKIIALDGAEDMIVQKMTNSILHISQMREHSEALNLIKESRAKL